MRKRKSNLLLVFGFVFVLMFSVISAPLEVSAKTTAVPVICFGIDANGDAKSVSAGIPMASDGDQWIFTNEDLYIGDDAQYCALVGEDVVEMEYLGNFDGLGMYLTVSGAENYYYGENDLDVPAIGETASVLYYNDSAELVSVEVKITGCSGKKRLDDALDLYVLEYEILDELSGNAIFPCTLVNENGCLMGLTITDDIILCSFAEPTGSSDQAPETEEPEPEEPETEEPEPEEEPDDSKTPSRPTTGDSGDDGDQEGGTTQKGNDGGKEENGTNAVIGVVAVAAVAAVVAVVVKKRKKTEEPSKVDSPVINSPVNNLPVNNAPVINPTMADQMMEESTRGDWETVAPEPKVNQGHSVSLIGVGGALNGLNYSFNQPKIAVGRGEGSDVLYPAATKGVSRNHCVVFWKDGKLMVMDTNSACGTWVASKGKLYPQAPVSLENDDVIYLGSKMNGLKVKIR